MSFYNQNNLEQQARTMLLESFSNIKAHEIDRLWHSIKAFIEKNPHIKAEDFAKALKALEEQKDYSVEKTEETVTITQEEIEEEVASQVEEDLLEEEVSEQEELRDELHLDKIKISADENIFDQCDNYIQEDIITFILDDINAITNEARSQALIDSIGGISTTDPYHLDRMIAIAPHQVIKGTLKAMYHHVGGMYQNLVLGSEIYPDEACFGGAIKDAIADSDHLRGHEPWQVRFSPNMDSHKPHP